MKCPNCDAEGGSGKFCRACGSPLSQPKKIVCSGCGKEILSTAKFCAKCGTRVASESAPGESCTKCGATLAAGAKFCKACGQSVADAARVAQTAAVPPSARAAVTAASAGVPAAPSISTPGPIGMAPAPEPPVAVSAQVATFESEVQRFPVQDSDQAVSPPEGSKKPILVGVVVAVLLISILTWFFAFREPTVNHAPVVKGPLYDQPSH